MNKFAVAVVVLVIIGCASKGNIVPEKHPEGVMLQFKFVPGDTMAYKQTTSATMTTQVQGMANSIDFSTETKLSYIVQDTGEITVLKIIYNDISGNRKMGEEVVSIKEIEELKGKTITLSLTREGKVSKIEGLEGIDYFRKSTEKPEQQFEGQFEFVPNKVVKIGDTWTKESEEGKTTYTLKGFETKEGIDCAIISEESKDSITKPIDQQGITGKINLHGTSKGDIWFAIKEGKLLSSKTSTGLEGEQEIKMASMSEPMKIPLYIDQTREIKIGK